MNQQTNAVGSVLLFCGGSFGFSPRPLRAVSRGYIKVNSYTIHPGKIPYIREYWGVTCKHGPEISPLDLLRMPIEALPHSTIRAIGSSSVISDPCSIVKELLDNALDASASSIAIEISQNTLDAIQVKDNGHGIPSEDHASACKRTFTSKIHTVEDLKNIGGKSLGFRGEALASAAEMSSAVTVITRVEAELAGSSIKYGRNGELISTQRAPHPVGTTVRISDFLKYIPVRRQTALKNTAKTLAKIKKMIQAYAMSQPSKRLSLKVLRAKNESNNWVYAPGQNATLMDAALKVSGAGIASICETRNWPPRNGVINSEQLAREDLSGYRLIALLPKADSDFSRLSNAGQYFSVDGRPLSTSRGIGRDITKLYRSYLRAAASRSEQSTSIADPFLSLHIQCPDGTYDVNIEPAKDDILLEDPNLVLSLVESLFQDVYGELASSGDKEPTSAKGKGRVPDSNGFELLLSRKSPVSPAASHQNVYNSVSSAAFMTPPSSLRSPISTGFRRDDLHKGEPRQEMTPLASSGTVSRDLESLNPWVITRMNVPNSQQANSGSAQNENRRFSLPTAKEGSRKLYGNLKPRPQQDAGNPVLTSPISSAFYSTAASPSGSHPLPSLQIPSQLSPTTSPDSSRKAMRERDRDRYGNGSLDTWFEKTTRAAFLPGAIDSEHGQDQEEPSLSQLAGARFGSQEQQSPGRSGAGTPSENISRPAPFQTPFESIASEPLHESNTGVNDALDFERRKKEVVQRRREQMRNHIESSVPSSSPHRSRYLAAKAALTSDYDPTSPSQKTSDLVGNGSGTALARGDPRAYLMRQQNAQHETGLNVKRTQTRKLPLESIPEGYDLHDASLTVPANLSQLSDAFTQMLDTDLYTQSGIDFQTLPTFGSEDLFQLWKGQLSALVSSNYRTRDGSQEPKLQFDFSAIRQHLNDFTEDGDS